MIERLKRLNRVLCVLSGLDLSGANAALADIGSGLLTDPLRPHAASRGHTRKLSHVPLREHNGLDFRSSLAHTKAPMRSGASSSAETARTVLLDNGENTALSVHGSWLQQGMESITNAVFGLVRAVIGPLIGLFKKRRAEMAAAEAPEKLQSIQQSSFDDVLGRIAAADPGDSFFKLLADTATNCFFTPEFVRTANVQAWLADPEVRRGISTLARSHLFDSLAPKDIRADVEARYRDIAMANAQESAAVISAVVAMLAAGVKARVSDSGTGALVVGVAQEMARGFEHLNAKLEGGAVPRTVPTSVAEPIHEADGPASKPNRVTPRPTYLAFVSNCLADGDSAHVVTLTLTTDEPDVVSRRVEEIKLQLEQHVLDKTLAAPRAPLAKLLGNVSTQFRVLEWLAATSFSAHLYFSSRAGLADQFVWSEFKRTTEFIVLPLVHRLSDKSLIVRRLASDTPKIESYLDAAIIEIEAKFHRIVHRPLTGDQSRNPNKALLELADLVLVCYQAYLSNPRDETARNIFAHVRTRLKYAANASTGERHTRDKNPLP